LNGSTKSEYFRYRRCGKLFVCLDQPVWDAVRFLWASYHSLHLDSLGISVSDTCKAVLAITLCKVSNFSLASFSLPVFGHVSMAVHRGYKVINFRHLTVTKVFTDNVSRLESEKQLAACKRASRIVAAPRFIEEGSDSSWFTEEYIRGIHGTMCSKAKSGDFMEFYPGMELCLLDLIGSESPTSVETKAYLDEITDKKYYTAWIRAGIESQVLDEIAVFQADTRSWLLENMESENLQLVLSHGDFSLVNVIVSADTLRVIDWEGLGFGSLYADIVNFVLVERYYGRARSNVVRDIADVLEMYGRSVLSAYPSLANMAAMRPDCAVRLYCLERLRLLLGRNVSPNLSSVVRKSIQLFRDFDTDAGYSGASHEYREVCS